MALINRAEVRLKGEIQAGQFDLLQEFCDLASTRICLHVRESELPVVLEPIAADVVVKIWRRCNYEGVSSETASKINTTFVENILAEYEDELNAYADSRAAESGERRVRFL